MNVNERRIIMTKEFKNNYQQEGQRFNYHFSVKRVSYIIYAISAGITSVLTIVITIIVSFLVLAGGLWLAFTYLPINVFNIIALVVLADIVFGVAVRFVLSRHNPSKETQ
jgi:hypothetical protein